MARQQNYFFVFMAAIAAFSGILFGYDTGVISGAILFIQDKFQLSPQLNGIVVGAVLFGALLGAIISGRLTDKLGRKNLLVVDAIIFIIGTVIAAVSPSILWLILGRLVVGFAIGIASYIAPLYISEISPAKHRGALVSFNQLAITIGILVSYIVDYLFAQHGQWRWMFAMGIIPAICLLIGMLFLPYSPRWILSKGHPDKALNILHRLRGDLAQAQQELEAIQESLKQQRGSWRVLFSPMIRPTLYIGIGLAVFQQITGINTIIYYAPTISRIAGFESAASAILATTGVGVIFVLFTIIALPLIDAWGRRILLFLGLAGMALSLAALSWTFHQTAAPSMLSLKWLALISMLVYIGCFAFSLGPIMWLMISEIYPLRVRGLGSSLATAANWGSNWLVAITFLTLIEYLGASQTFLIYCVISLFALGFVYFFVPETKGVTLERIEANLYAGRSSRHLGSEI